MRRLSSAGGHASKLQPWKQQCEETLHALTCIDAACRLLGTGPGTVTFVNATELAATVVDSTAFFVDSATYTGAAQAAAIVNQQAQARRLVSSA